jgi:16S rRNA (cytosine967-C5)-methyltransferase
MGDDPRRVALRALRRIDEGAFANLVLPPLLERSDLDERDRHFATELTYGTTRMRRACDWLVDRFVTRPVDPDVRNALRLGAYQLEHLKTPPHAAVSSTVDVAPGRARGFVNAVLRKVAGAPRPEWPDLATELSYPDWIVERLSADLGADDARAALMAMNEPRPPTVRADGYVQDTASQWVAAAADADGASLAVDTCAGPGGKATALGAERVLAFDVQPHRAALVAANATRHRHPEVHTAIADGRSVPLPRRCADRVLVDAPCSGLGVLGRRADARWRVGSADVDRLAMLQRELLAEALDLVRSGGLVVYSACTLTRAETVDIDSWLFDEHAEFRAVPPPAPWTAIRRGGRVLPQDHGTDGMYVLRLRAP